MKSIRADVFVAGGGPAGLAAAIAARLEGFTVSLADARIPPIDKACGEGIMPDGLAAAAALGIRLDPSLGYPFRGIRFHDGERSVEAAFPGGFGIGVRRTVLHRALAEHAAGLGVDLLWGVQVTGMADDVVMLEHGTLGARWIIGADGNGSRVRQWSGLDAASRHSSRFGFRRHFRIAPWSEYMELHWSDQCQIYVTPVGREEICVAVISRDPRLRLDRALAHFPRLAARLPGAEASAERGGASITRRLRAVSRGRVALIGDASGSVDAITGEGLCLLFQQARALAGAIARNDLSSYENAHRRIGKRPAFMAGLMLALDGRPRLRSAVLGTLAAQPNLFRGLLALHVGAESL